MVRAGANSWSIYALLEAPFWFSTQHPILGPLSTVDVPLRVVVPYGFLLRDVVGVARESSALGRWEVGSLWSGLLEVGDGRGRWGGRGGWGGGRDEGEVQEVGGGGVDGTELASVVALCESYPGNQPCVCCERVLRCPERLRVGHGGESTVWISFLRPHLVMGKAAKKSTRKFAASGRLKKTIESRRKHQQTKKKIQGRRGANGKDKEAVVSEASSEDEQPEKSSNKYVCISRMGCYDDRCASECRACPWMISSVPSSWTTTRTAKYGFSYLTRCSSTTMLRDQTWSTPILMRRTTKA